MIFAWLALATKRLHDRNKNAWWLVPFVFVPVVCQGMAINVLSWSGIAWLLVLIISGVFGLWGSIELLFLQGSVGNNRFGPDPLGGPVVNPFSDAKSG